MSSSASNTPPDASGYLESLSRPALLLNPRDYTIHRSNAAFRKTTGFSSADLVNRNLAEFFAPDAEAPDLFKTTARWVPGFLKLRGGSTLRCQKQARRTSGPEPSPIVVFDPLESSDLPDLDPPGELDRSHTGTGPPSGGDPDDPTPVRDTFDRLVEQHDQVALMRLEIDEFHKLIGCLSSNSIGTLRRAVTECIPNGSENLDQYQIDYETILIYPLESPGSLQAVAEDVLRSVEDPKRVDSQTYYLHANLGIALYPDNGSTLDELMQCAKFSQRQAARDRGSSYRFYESTQARRAREEVELVNHLYEAMDDNQFELYYQPLVSLEDGSIRGAEALIRWNHPKRGLLTPGDFIETAEATGQILFLDQWVLKTAVATASEWQGVLPVTIQTNINISALQFQDHYLIDKLETSLEQSNLPADQFQVEITERSIMEDTDYTARVMESLKDIGVRIALDDFGTGHATFENLTRFPIDVLKIDRAFLNFDDVYNKNQKLLEIMIETGHRIGVDIVAEGVETSQQLHFLRNKGCHYAQGFYFARPASRSRFEQLVDETPVFPINGRS